MEPRKIPGVIIGALMAVSPVAYTVPAEAGWWPPHGHGNRPRSFFHKMERPQAESCGLLDWIRGRESCKSKDAKEAGQ